LRRPGPLRILLLLIIGSLSVSCASIFVRLASAPPLAIAAYRMLWATLILSPFALTGPIREISAISRRDMVKLSLSGVALALHFALWISSLSFTSVASSVLLVDTTPFFIGLASRYLLNRPPARSFWIGLLVAFIGCLAIFSDDWTHSQSTAKGNLLALGGAVSLAVYLLIGAQVRQRLTLLTYVWPVYSVSALTLGAYCYVSHTPLGGFGFPTTLYLFLLGLIPQCIGHTAYNWSLRWLPPALVGVLIMAEPVGAILLAYVILEESLSLLKAAGAAVVLLGISLAARHT